MMTSLFESYVRWRHTRGFGVHSTFGYLLITDALYLRRPYSYYAEHLPALDDHGGADAGLARRLYRAAVFLRARTGATRIGVFGELPQGCRDALRLAGLGIGNSGPEDPALYYGVDAPGEKFHGLQLDGRRWTLRVPRPQMEFTHYILP